MNCPDFFSKLIDIRKIKILNIYANSLGNKLIFLILKLLYPLLILLETVLEEGLTVEGMAVD